jgi:hypothetical protein
MWVNFYLVNYGMFLEQRIPNVMNFSFHTHTTRSPTAPGDWRLATAVRIKLVKSYVTQTDACLPDCCSYQISEELRHADCWRLPDCCSYQIIKELHHTDCWRLPDCCSYQISKELSHTDCWRLPDCSSYQISEELRHTDCWHLPDCVQSRCVCLLYPIQFSYIQHFEYLYSATQLSVAQCSCSKWISLVCSQKQSNVALRTQNNRYWNHGCSKEQ